MTDFTGEIHPFADAFPMLPEDDLKALAASIRNEGQQHPIVLTPKGVLLDGRNRLEACRIAKVEPTFVEHHGDPVALIVAENMQRRNLNSGQRAMLGAKARCSETEQSQRAAAKMVGVSATRLAVAETILKHAPPALADAVIAGTVPIDEAYQEARKRKQGASKDDRMQRLRDQASDLADQVDDERLSLEEATAAFKARIGNAKSAARNLRRDLTTVIELGPQLGTTPLDKLPLAYANDEPPVTDGDITAARDQLNKAAAALENIHRYVKEMENA